MLLGVVLAIFYEPRAGIVEQRVAAGAGLRRDVSHGVEQLRAERAARRARPTSCIRRSASARCRRARSCRPSRTPNGWRSAAAGIGLSFTINRYFGLSALALWLLGVSYNVPPVRTKEWPYLDVISESANNAVRLLLGWFALLTTAFPPVSLLLSYWMVGAFFMATKRYAEYRHIANPEVAAGYRKSFRHYTEEHLLLSIVFYATTSALFAGIFIVRYHLELILFVPLAAGMFTYYLQHRHAARQPGAESREAVHASGGSSPTWWCVSRSSCC